MGDTRWRGAKEENWDNYTSIINKIYFKKNLIVIFARNKLGNGMKSNKGGKNIIQIRYSGQASLRH